MTKSIAWRSVRRATTVGIIALIVSSTFSLPWVDARDNLPEGKGACSCMCVTPEGYNNPQVINTDVPITSEACHSNVGGYCVVVTTAGLKEGTFRGCQWDALIVTAPPPPPKDPRKPVPPRRPPAAP
jgi:hypothetical protein